jgi:hypothetical protein
VSLALILITLAYSIWAYFHALKHTKFKWVQNMILLCLISNIENLYACLHDVFTGWNPLSEAVLTFIDVAGYYGF